MTKIPTNIVSRLTITRYSDRPAHLDCTGDIVETAKMLAVGLEILANIIEARRGRNEQAPVGTDG